MERQSITGRLRDLKKPDPGLHVHVKMVKQLENCGETDAIDFPVSGVIKRTAGRKLDAKLATLGGCRPGEAKTTLGKNNES
jgi:hypothetical protein